MLLVGNCLALDAGAWWLLRWCGYFDPLPCHRCGRQHAPPWFYRMPHRPQADWDVLDRQCRAINPGR